VESSIHLPEYLGLNSARQCRHIDPFRSDVMIRQHTLKVTGQPSCCNAIDCYRSLRFTREGNAQASALQDHHLWLWSLSVGRKLTAAAPAAARLLTLLLNGDLGERQPSTP
jgi:hypothetical protein